jgi:hypothetical protein
MAQVPTDVLSLLQSHRWHVRTSAERVRRGLELHAEVQARIEASVALIERLSALKRADGVAPQVGATSLEAKQHNPETKRDGPESDQPPSPGDGKAAT